MKTYWDFGGRKQTGSFDMPVSHISNVGEKSMVSCRNILNERKVSSWDFLKKNDAGSFHEIRVRKSRYGKIHSNIWHFRFISITMQ